jgi:hypothetical protein
MDVILRNELYYPCKSGRCSGSCEAGDGLGGLRQGAHVMYDQMLWSKALKLIHGFPFLTGVMRSSRRRAQLSIQMKVQATTDVTQAREQHAVIMNMMI